MYANGWPTMYDAATHEPLTWEQASQHAQMLHFMQAAEKGVWVTSDDYPGKHGFSLVDEDGQPNGKVVFVEDDETHEAESFLGYFGAEELFPPVPEDEAAPSPLLALAS